ncbi:hypothetical protein JRQ81_006440, partial [Phrynocephalus forsythii]
SFSVVSCLYYNTDTHTLLYYLLKDRDPPFGSSTWIKKLLTWGLNVEQIGSLGEKQAFGAMRRRVLDIEQQTLWSLAHSVHPPLHWHITLTPSQQAPYLALLKSPWN